MTRKPKRDIAELVRDDALVDAAIARAQAEAVRRHRLLGLPVVFWRDGRVVVERPIARVSEDNPRTDNSE